MLRVVTPEPRRGGRPAVTALLVLAAALLAACSAAAAPSPSFDPSTPCGDTDVQDRPGFFPELESLIPERLFDETLARRSGRYCSQKTIGLLYERGVRELRFAGASWYGEDPAGMALAIYAAPGLDAAVLAASFEAGARAERDTELVKSAPARIAGIDAIRIDAYVAKRDQSVIVWDDPSRPGVVRVVIASDTTPERIEAAVAALAAR